MKKVFAALVVLMTAHSAMADVNTICQGGGRKGNEIRIEIVHVLSDIGSQSEKVTINGQNVLSTYVGKKGEALAFNLQSPTRVFGLDYNQLDATAILTGQGINLKLFCSRY